MIKNIYIKNYTSFNILKQISVNHYLHYLFQGTRKSNCQACVEAYTLTVATYKSVHCTVSGITKTDTVFPTGCKKIPPPPSHNIHHIVQK